MASIVKVPKNSHADYDFLAFSFGGKHSVEDFGVYRTGKNDGYSLELNPTLVDKTVDVVGGDGTYFFGTTHKNKIFNIDFAFENLTEKKLRELKQWLNGKEIQELWFAEEPYKVYSAKVTGLSKISFIAFENDNERIYKGNGTVQFTCYYPYAHTPDFVQKTNGTLLAGDCSTSYLDFSNYEQIKTVLPDAGEVGYGDLPFSFVAYLDDVDFKGVSQLLVEDEGITYILQDSSLELEELQDVNGTLVLGGNDVNKQN